MPRDDKNVITPNTMSLADPATRVTELLSVHVTYVVLFMLKPQCSRVDEYLLPT